MSPTPGAWTIEREGDARWARCAGFRAGGVVHGFGLRDGTPLNGLRLEHEPAAAIRQVHGSRLLRVRGGAEGGAEEADGLWARVADLAAGAWIGIRTADCVPILLAARDGSRIAAVHAGWRGTAAGIAARAVERLGEDGCPPASLLAALGPAIGPCCYEVDAPVRDAVCGASHGAGAVPATHRGKSRLDLHAANRTQLERAGIAPDSVFAAPWCSACEPALLHSWRRDGERAGRQVSVVGRARPLA